MMYTIDPERELRLEDEMGHIHCFEYLGDAFYDELLWEKDIDIIFVIQPHYRCIFALKEEYDSPYNFTGIDNDMLLALLARDFMEDHSKLWAWLSSDDVRFVRNSHSYTEQ